MIAQEAYRFDQNDPIDTFNQIARSLCPFCGEDPGLAGFRDEKTRQEYQISGLCQVCQDDFFGE